MARSQRGDSYADISGVIGTGGQSQKLCGEQTNRLALLIQNVSAADLWINFGVDAVMDAPSFRIPAGGFFSMDNKVSYVDCSEVFIIGATTGQKYSAREAS